MKRDVTHVDALRERASATPDGARNRSTVAGVPRRASDSVSPLEDEGRSLRHRQLRFARAIMTAESLASPLDERQAARWFTAGPALSALERIDIYRRAYHSRLIECLADDYQTIQYALGEAGFEELCRGYIARFPSDGPSLNFFGRRMRDFVRDEMPESFAHRGFVADLAALEWAIVEVIHAESEPPLTADGLRDIPPEQWAGVRLTATSAMAMLVFDYPVNEYFQSFREGRAPAIPAPARSSTVVYRSGPTVWRMDLSEPMVMVLSALVEGETLAAALARAETNMVGLDESHVAATVTTWFREWVGHGLFVRASW